MSKFKFISAAEAKNKISSVNVEIQKNAAETIKLQILEQIKQGLSTCNVSFDTNNVDLYQPIFDDLISLGYRCTAIVKPNKTVITIAWG